MAELLDTIEIESGAAPRAAVIWMHGTHDPLISLGRGRRSRDLLVDLGYRVAWREYPVPHAVCDAEISDVSRWLSEVLDSDPTS